MHVAPVLVTVHIKFGPIVPCASWQVVAVQGLEKACTQPFAVKVPLPLAGMNPGSHMHIGMPPSEITHFKLSPIPCPLQVVAEHSGGIATHPCETRLPEVDAGMNPGWHMQVAPLSVLTHCKFAPMLFPAFSAQVVDEQLAIHPN